MSGPDRDQDPATRSIRWIESGTLTVLFLILLLLGLADIGFRALAGMTLPWIDAAMRAVVLWLVMTGAVVATGRLRHIRIGVLECRLPAVAVVWLRRVLFAATALICLALTWTSLDIVALEYEFQAVAFLNVPMWVVRVIIPIGFAMMAARFLAWAVSPPSAALSPVPDQGEPE
ncbi:MULTISPECIES: TRAP transporter small permease [unclassified Wenzhouxiangella]|uniref:TRAP transporter small permease n=1 Tax=unclassified Wenzhouxiangella TaxID=2613841 RepID=UPI000E3277B1|nr:MULTISPECIES: TRAP transporter small permease [unclassified Wenzhouxiangella]RFF27962.1 TRAP transporter small permease [Wenzhouxiangella sp. 15181]RFP68549.1 TRAP transporter small permease [Wenzhouxiangella sp. 15190]